MNIYHLDWLQSDSYLLSAVIIASTEAEARAVLDLDRSYNSEATVVLLGPCTDGTTAAREVCRESL